MKIEEAIKINIATKRAFKDNLLPHEQDALSLSIEAMKAVDGFRKKQLTRPFHLLPGETEE